MCIITISRGCYSHGKEIAERVALGLGYELISKEILLEASESFNIPESNLSSSVHDAPGFLERVIHSNERLHYLECIRTALLEHVKSDNVVYHGLAGNLFLAGISHVIKIRVIAEMADRLDLMCEKRRISTSEAIALIESEDRQREQWYQAVYKKDMSDPRLYDMVLHIGRMTIDDASELICTAAARESFRATEQSLQVIKDLAILSHVQTALVELCECDVTVSNGIVTVKARRQKLRGDDFTRPGMKQRVQSRIREDLQQDIAAVVSRIPDVKDLICEIEPPYYA